jgi:BCCT family betaine/carnitine transporter
MDTEPRIDPKVLWPSLILVLAFSGALLSFPDRAGEITQMVLSWISLKFGWLFLIFGLGSVLFLVWLGFGRYGQVKLGGPEDEPEFSTFSWIAMLFCGGMGIAIVNWAFVEPAYYLASPPFGLEPFSNEAAEWAGMYGQFHWGVTPWAIYGVPAFAVAYSLYVRKRPFLRLSTASEGVIRSGSPIALIFDVVVIFGIIGGVGTSLGLGIPLVSMLAGDLLGIPDSFGLKIAILLIWTAIFTTSVFLGLKKGIRLLSDINLKLSLALLFYVFVVGPSIFIISLWTNSFGLYLKNFLRLSLWTDPIATGGFPQDWTIPYWAWWLALSPMMGLFVARISKGRTVRQLVLAQLLGGGLGSWLFMGIWGGFANYLTLNEIVNVSDILKEGGIPAAVVACLHHLPAYPYLIGPAFTLLCFIFLATTLDSSAYTLASLSYRNLKGDQEPARWSRVLWAIVIAVVPISLLSVGGLEVVQLSSVLVALPMIPVMVVLAISLLRWLGVDFGERLRPEPLTLQSSAGGSKGENHE